MRIIREKTMRANVGFPGARCDPIHLSSHYSHDPHDDEDFHLQIEVSRYVIVYGSELVGETLW